MALSKTKKDLRAIEDEIERHATEANEIIEKASKEGRDRTEDENAEVASHQAALKTLRQNKREKEDALSVEEDIASASDKIKAEPVENKSNLSRIQVGPTALGDQFVNSEAYKKAISEVKGKGIPENFRTGPVEMDVRGKAGTVLEGGQGAGLIPVPQVVPGVTEKLFQRLTVADLIPTGTTNNSSLRYVVEGTATSGAAGVAEGAAKPASDLALSTVDEPVKKIATILTASDEMLEDAAQVQSYINGRLSLFVKIEEERQLLLGGGTNDLVGIAGRTGVNTYGRGTVDNNAVALFKAINGTRGSAFLEPDAIIMNPANWQTTRLLTDTAGQFFGGGPFQGPYGSGSNLGASGQVTGAIDSIWGKPVIVTSAIGSGTALLGSFSQASQIFRRGGLTVEATNSHASYFTSNLVAIRAEERLALAVYRPAAFTLVSGLS